MNSILRIPTEEEMFLIKRAVAKLPEKRRFWLDVRLAIDLTVISVVAIGSFMLIVISIGG